EDVGAGRAAAERVGAGDGAAGCTVRAGEAVPERRRAGRRRAGGRRTEGAAAGVGTAGLYARARDVQGRRARRITVAGRELDDAGARRDLVGGLIETGRAAAAAEDVVEQRRHLLGVAVAHA